MRQTRLWLGVALAVLTIPVAVAAATLSVAVKEGPVRATATPFGRVVATLPYGAQVEMQDRQGAWVRIKTTRASGWMHASALSDKRLALQAGKGTAQSGASVEEVTLAGKGFNAQVEGEFRQRNRDLDYRWIDRMAGSDLPQDEVLRFMREGRLAAGVTP